LPSTISNFSFILNSDGLADYDSLVGLKRVKEIGAYMPHQGL